MNFLIGEILICLIAASLLGVLVGWLLKAVFSARKVARVEEEWDSKFRNLDSLRTTEINELTAKNDILHKDISGQRNKLDTLGSDLGLKETAVLESQAKIKTLSSTLEERESDIKAAKSETEKLVTRQQEITQKLEAIVVAKDREITTLKNEVLQAGKSSTETPGRSTSGSAGIGYSDPLRAPKKPAEPSTKHTDNSATTGLNTEARIKALNEQRQRLITERKQLEEREQHFSSKLEHGDDTRAYLDETVQMDSTLSAAADPSRKTTPGSQSPQTAAPVSRTSAGRTQESGAQESRSTDSTSSNPSANTENEQSGTQKDNGSNGGSLWDKVKSTVNKTVDKTKI